MTVYRWVTKWIDPYILVMIGVIAFAALLPARGAAVRPVEWVADVGVVFLFFLYGARLSTEETKQGFLHWRLHLLVLAITFVAFPAVGIGLAAAARPVLGPELAAGVVFLAVLPSTVQSSIAFTSIARGNIAAAICAASFSNVLGVLITPTLVGLFLGAQSVIDASTVVKLVVQLVLPFAVGQLLHRRMAGFLSRHKDVLKYTDRGAILLIVYVAFSAGMRENMWSRIPVSSLLILAASCAVLLAIMMTGTMLVSRALGFSWPDRVAIIFAGSKKSMASGLPMAQVLFPANAVGVTVLPLMLFHQLQLIVCAQLSKRWSNLPSQPAESPEAEQIALRGIK